MSSNVNAIIKLRTDTIENWAIYNPIIHENEQIVVKLSDGKIGYKLGTGVRFNSTPFISYESISTDTINHGNAVLSLPTESGTLATLLPLYSNLQVIKPNCNFQSYIHVVVSDHQDFSKILFEIDSKVSYDLFRALNNGKWFNIGSGGFGVEYNNCPVLINFKENLKSYNITPSTILYINYYWYYNDENDELIKSDIYSSVLPSNTEVGANSQDTVSRSELLSVIESKADIEYVDNKLSDITGNTLISDENNEVYKVIRYTESSPAKWISSNLDSTYGFDVLSYGNGKFVGTYSQGNRGIYYSSDGIKWIKSDAPLVQYHKIIYNNGKFVVASDDGVWISSNGINWTKSFDGESFISITYGNGKYTVIRNILDDSILNYEIFESVDLIDWNYVSGFDKSSVNDLSYCGDKYLIGTSNLGIWYSVDCKNWIKSSQSSGCIYSISYKNNRYVAIAPDNILVSNDGINWRIIETDISYSKLICSDNSFIISGTTERTYNCKIYQSLDGDNWIEISDDYFSNFCGIVYGDNKLIVIEDHRTRYTYLNTTIDVKLPLADKDYVDSKLDSIYSTYSNIQVIKPYSNNRSHLKLVVSVDPEFNSTLFELDSKVNYDKFKGLANSDGAKWLGIDETGFGVEYNNKPILINLLDNIKSSNIYLSSNTILYINYYWYYESDDSDIIKSDIYSTTLPSNTEVGANSQDVVSKREFSELSQNIVIQSQLIEKDTSTMYDHFRCYSYKYNILNNVNDGDYIALDSYEFGKTYKLRITIGDSNTILYFVKDELDGFEDIPELTVSSPFVFSANKTYLVTIECGHIRVREDSVYIIESSIDTTSQSFKDAVLSLINDNFSNAESTQY